MFKVWTIFHQLWADAHTLVYHKTLWQRMQAELQKLEEQMTPTATPSVDEAVPEPVERIELGPVGRRIAREEAGIKENRRTTARDLVVPGPPLNIVDRMAAELEPAAYAGQLPANTVAISVGVLLHHLTTRKNRLVLPGDVDTLIDELCGWAGGAQARVLMSGPPPVVARSSAEPGTRRPLRAEDYAAVRDFGPSMEGCETT